MNKLTVCSIFAAIALAVAMPSAFADHAKIEVNIPAGASSPGCETTNECFVPAEVTVDVGGEVTWSNDDSASHTVTSGDPKNGPDGIFDSNLFLSGQTFSHMFEKEGEFPYFCLVHPWMQGTVIVQEAGAEEHEEAEVDQEEYENYVESASSDGSVMVKIGSGKPTSGEDLSLAIEFTDADENPIEHVNYGISAMQDGTEVLNEAAMHAMSGSDQISTAVLRSDSPVDVQVTILGIGPEDDESGWTGPKGDAISLKVVPEFGPLVMTILAVSIIGIVAITSKSKVMPRL
ncbi:MAG: plastocyanin/azurin family copper-binding protein [Candidatus Nitrosotenuis sp.]